MSMELCKLFEGREEPFESNSSRPMFQCTKSDVMWQMSISYCVDIGFHGSKKSVIKPPASRYIKSINEWPCSRAPLVNLKTDFMNWFGEHVIPHIRREFFLLTMASAYPVPAQFLKGGKQIKNCPMLLHWFTINYDGNPEFQDTITVIPIGVDLHTSSKFITDENKYRALRNEVTQPQYRSLDVWNDATPRSVVYFGASREQSLKKIKKNPLVHSLTKWTSQNDVFHKRAEHLFLASPVGNGIDTLRVFEGLYFDHIVIVRHTSLDELYDNLPVVMVHDWDEITLENLKKWKEKYYPLLGSAETRYKLTTGYWLHYIKQLMIKYDRNIADSELSLN